MLKATDKILKTKSGKLSFLDQGKAEALRTLMMVTDDGNFIELNTWKRARILFSTFAKPGQTPRSRIIFAVEGVLSCKWKKEADGDQMGSPFAPLEEVLTSQDRPNMKIQDLISNRWKKLPEEVGLSFAMLEETLSTADGALHKRRMRIQDLVVHAMVVCGAEALPGRAPCGNR